jgi:serine/threonine protein kinase
VTDGLAAIHRAGFVHRTLGTHNVIVDNRGNVLLADLGCATPVGADDAAAKAFRSFMRPASAAPEQFTIDAAFSPAIDNWALGVALFELRYGRHPFWTEIPTTTAGVAAAILGGDLRFPAIPGETSEHLLQPWLRRLLERAPEKRYSDALEAQRDLHAIAAEIEGRRAVARAFVAMPFGAGFDGLWRAISSACVACRVSATRVDQSHRHENIWDEICDAIRSSDFTIAVAAPDSASVPNPNVMLEIGYARALHKPVLLLTDAPDTLPFDLRTQRALLYRTTSVGGGEFHRELVSFIAGIVARSVRDNAAEGN